MSASAAIVKDSRLSRFWNATAGKKAVMALTGFILFGFVVVHMAGNLQIFLGPEKFNGYAKALKALPALLWGARAVLLASVFLHIWAAVELWSLKNAARPVAYAKRKPIVSTYASRTMYWSGPILAAFIVYHLLHFTIGAGGTPFDEHDPYTNVVRGFQVLPIAFAYIVAMSLLCMHLYHGVWSLFQTLGVQHPRYTPVLRNAAKAFAFLVFLGFISVPAGVIAGVVR